MSLGSVLSCYDRCVRTNASYLIMVLYSSLKRELTPNLLGLFFSHVLGTRKSLKTRKIKRKYIYQSEYNKCNITY